MSNPSTTNQLFELIRSKATALHSGAIIQKIGDLGLSPDEVQPLLSGSKAGFQVCRESETVVELLSYSIVRKKKPRTTASGRKPETPAKG